MCFNFLGNFCLKHFSFWEEILSKTYICRHVKYRLLLADFNETCILATYFGDNIQISNFMKTHSVGAEFLDAERRTDRRKDGGTAGQTNRHDETNCSSSQFFERA
jgi:hypothetical protein